ncbi:hypothetical protein EJ08DRAFT_431162 [Tothia fuscella]|uniref:Uncharacterized protein n=1 Tax=Tothia fuscella TaxID=1048955 RepID=A0A9P4P184_9PEZI|nr:hypothetical protein EJ08DRAFT_431162 [Tothia fuscella]
MMRIQVLRLWDIGNTKSVIFRAKHKWLRADGVIIISLQFICQRWLRIQLFSPRNCGNQMQREGKVEFKVDAGGTPHVRPAQALDRSGRLGMRKDRCVGSQLESVAQSGPESYTAVLQRSPTQTLPSVTCGATDHSMWDSRAVWVFHEIRGDLKMNANEHERCGVNWVRYVISINAKHIGHLRALQARSNVLSLILCFHIVWILGD